MKIKLLNWLILIILFLSIPIFALADDEDYYLYVFSSFAEDSSKLDVAPDINSRHSVILDRNSKTIIYGKKENEICKMASTTKIMTCLVVLENSNLDDIVTVSAKAANTGGSRLGLSKGDKITVKNLLYGLMLKSGNDAAVALAEHIGGSVENFATMMNTKAKELNLSSTHFTSPHGLDDDNHYTTAYELAMLSDYALSNKRFADIVKTNNYTIIQNGYPKSLNNTNELLGSFEGIYGIKTGFTNGANRCLVTACRRGDLDVICVVLGCDTKKDRTHDTVKLLNYIFQNYSVVNVKDIIEKDFKDWLDEHQNSFVINKGLSQKIELKLDENDYKFSSISVNKSKIDKISSNISFTSQFEAPLQNNTTIGKISLEIDGINYYSIDILNSNSINKKNCFDYLLYFFKNYLNFFNNIGYN